MAAKYKLHYFTGVYEVKGYEGMYDIYFTYQLHSADFARYAIWLREGNTPDEPDDEGPPPHRPREQIPFTEAEIDTAIETYLRNQATRGTGQ